MTHHTDAERAQALAEKHGATSYRNRADTQNPAYGFTPIQLAALIADVEQAARRTQVVPHGWREALTELVAAMRKYEMDVDGIAPAQHRAMMRRAELLLAAAPQPPEAAPVQLPEPSAWMLGCQTMGGDVGWKLSWYKSGAGVCHRLSGEEFEHPLYTEQQVRDLLAAHGIQEQST